MARWAEDDRPRAVARTEPPPQDLWYPAIPENEAPEDRAARRDAYAEAVDATRFNLPVFGTSFLDPAALQQLIPPRRGNVQGPATRPDELGPFEPWTPAAPVAAGTAEAARERQAAPATSVSRASRIMALGTIVSRVTGMIRQLLLVAALGTAALGTGYNIANNVPNTIYLLVIGGAVNSIFVPQLVRAMKDDPDGGRAFMDRLLTLTMVIMAALTLACVMFAPQIVSLFSPNATDANRAVTIIFARYMLPQIFFYGMFVMFGQILNAKDKFGPMMWTPVLANIVQIATFGAYLWIAGYVQSTANITANELALLGLGSTISIALQTVALIPYLRQAGIGFRPRFDWRGVGLGQSMNLAKWTMGMVLVGQISTTVITRLSSSMDTSGPHQTEGVGYTAYSNALTIWIMPQAIITVSIITALLPRMSRSAQAADRGAVRDSISYGLRVSAVAIVPCAFLFLAFGQQIAALLFEHGATNATMARNLGYMLMAFGLGLIPFSAQYLMMRGFYAYEDTKTPFIVTAWISFFNGGLAYISYALLHTTKWAVAGMCVGYVIAYTIGMVMTASRLSRKLRGLDTARIVRTHAKLAASSALGAAIGGPIGFEVTQMLHGGLVGASAGVVVGGGLFGALFLAAARKMRIEEVDMLLGTMRSRFGR
ncbi:murein biosynthesis integral membrane protein MurJ [Actinocrinis puniceicyclus]|uniref:Murein biosynthesis integral membrane protein MurJ n=1 Tax=Actinocrinis puniceicyclus TaxID=977794 RepID=A0A8J7WMD7_9ACTN|nr:murein biosynthesis integral membrane protein MurJ [Actinocrinis puniceicyclus]MBS2962130.1 murein biosynthesis integral membrane protein MurJ [Actinocrinis puniceicyclus]